MTYIDQINAFHNWADCNKISTNAQILWLKLMDHFNRNFWPESLEITPYTLKTRLQLTRNATLSEARKELCNLGLIDYEPKSYTYRLHFFDSVTDPKLSADASIDANPATKATKEKPKTVKKPAKPKAPPIPYDEILEFWNAHHRDMPKLQDITDNRKRQLQKLIKAGYSVDDLKKAILKAEQSDFMNGNNDKNWKAHFNWVINPSNIIKVLEGNYDNSPKPQRDMTVDEYLTAGGSGQIDILGQPVNPVNNQEGFTDYEVSDAEVFTMNDIGDIDEIKWE